MPRRRKTAPITSLRPGPAERIHQGRQRRSNDTPLNTRHACGNRRDPRGSTDGPQRRRTRQRQRTSADHPNAVEFRAYSPESRPASTPSVRAIPLSMDLTPAHSPALPRGLMLSRKRKRWRGLGGAYGYPVTCIFLFLHVLALPMPSRCPYSRVFYALISLLPVAV